MLLAEIAAAGVRVQACVTSPPYFGLRDYGNAAQIGLEPTPAEYVEQLVAVFRLVRDVLADDGTIWLNLGDSYAQHGGPGWQGKNGQRADRRFTAVRDTVPMREAGRRIHDGYKPKDLMGIPWRVAFALQDDGWYLRSDIIWHKPNPMPESVTDRPTKSHEYLFLLAKSERYYYDAAVVGEPFADDRKGASGAKSLPYSDGSGRNDTLGNDSKHGLGVTPINEWRNLRTVWTIATTPFSGAHFATFPRALIEPCILAGCPAGGTVIDPFMRSGTTGQVATDLGRNFIGCELNQKYVDLHELRRTTIGMAI